MKIFIKSNMLIIQTDSSILSVEWFGDFILSHSKDMIFLPMSIVIFFDEMLSNKRNEFLTRLAKLYSEKSEFYYEQLLNNLLKYRHKPIKLEFKQEGNIMSDVEIYLDAISSKEVKILLKENNSWIIAYFSSQLAHFVTEHDSRRIFLNASGERSKSRLDRVLKRQSFLFFNFKFTYSKNFLTILFNEYINNNEGDSKNWENSSNNNQSSGFNFNRENSFNSKGYYQDPVLLGHYNTLELSYGAKYEDVKGGYRRLAKMYHPDRVMHKNETIVNLYTKKFQEIHNSYQFLKDYLKEE